MLYLVLCIHAVEISSQTTDGKYPAAKDQGGGTTRALIIGISDYKYLRDLNYAHSDAVSFYNYLISPFGGYVHPQNVVLLSDSLATALNIFCVLNWLIDESHENDHVIIFFAGHGDTESKLESREGFLLCYDSPQACYRACGLSISDLQAYIQTLTAVNKSKVVLISDACRAGNLAGDHDGMKHTTAALAAQWENVIKILSSKPGEYSFENKKWGQGSGVFSYFLINGLLGLADKDTNNNVTGIELYSYLAERVSQETEKSQTPLYVGDPMYVLSTYPQLYSDTTANIIFGGIRTAEDPSSWHLNYVRNTSDSTTYSLYRDFWECIDQQNLLPVKGLKINALDLYQKILETVGEKSIRQLGRNFLISALQRKSTEVMNEWLNNGEIRDKAKIKQAIEELKKALLLVDSTYILYKHIKSDRLFLSSLLPGTKNKKINLLKQVIELELDASYAHFALSRIYFEKSKLQEADESLYLALRFSPNLDEYKYIVEIEDKLNDALEKLNDALVRKVYRKNVQWPPAVRNLMKGEEGFEKKEMEVPCYSEKPVIAYLDSIQGPRPLCSIEGTVFDNLTKQPVKGAKVIADGQSGYHAETITDDNEYFKLDSIPCINVITIKVEKEDYFTGIAQVDMSKTRDKIRIGLDPLAGWTIAGVFFDFDKATLNPASVNVLDSLVLKLKLNHRIFIEIGSHTDNRGSDQYNLGLSERRGKSVVDYLLSHGIKPDQLVSKAFGERELLIKDAKTEAEHQLNRRTTFKIIITRTGP